MTEFAERYGPWAVVAGAGAGLGEAYARQLARRGLGVVLVDRDGDALARLAGELDDADTHSIVLDLGRDDAPDEILRRTADLDVGLLVLNAAASHVGWFASMDEEAIRTQVAVNVVNPAVLVHRFLPRLLARPRSGIVLMSSQSSRRGAPLVAAYAATKAYLAILAESLWDELGDDGVDVLAVLPGSTRTPGWLSSLPQAGLGTATLMLPDDVVREALDALGSGIPSIVAGAENRASEELLDSLPRADAVRMVGEVMRAMYPDERDVDPTV